MDSGNGIVQMEPLVILPRIQLVFPPQQNRARGPGALAELRFPLVFHNPFKGK